MRFKNIYAVVYLDDILIFCDTIQEHVRRLRMFLDRIREAKFKLNLGKCTFVARELCNALNRRRLGFTSGILWDINIQVA